MVCRSADAIAIRNRRVAEHLFLVRRVASHYAACTAERRDDLQQVGAIGLIRAAERYDSTSPVPFAAFARPHIRGAVLHYLRDVAPLLRLSRRVQERAFQLNQQWRLAVMEQKPVPGSVRAELDQFERLRSVQLLPPWRLQEAQQAELDFSIQENRTQNHSGPIVEADDALAALRRLGLRERQVVEGVVLQGQTLRAVAERLGISAATVHRVLHQTLAELRRQLSPASDVRAC